MSQKTDVVESINGAVDHLRSVRDSISDADAKSELGEALADLADAKLAIVEMREELAALQKQADVSNEIQYREPCYWMGDDGPFCQACYDGNKKLVRVHEIDHGVWSCKVCHHHFQKDAETKSANM